MYLTLTTNPITSRVNEAADGGRTFRVKKPTIPATAVAFAIDGRRGNQKWGAITSRAREERRCLEVVSRNSRRKECEGHGDVLHICEWGRIGESGESSWMISVLLRDRGGGKRWGLEECVRKSKNRRAKSAN